MYTSNGNQKNCLARIFACILEYEVLASMQWDGLPNVTEIGTFDTYDSMQDEIKVSEIQFNGKASSCLLKNSINFSITNNKGNGFDYNFDLSFTTLGKDQTAKQYKMGKKSLSIRKSFGLQHHNIEVFQFASSNGEQHFD